MYNLQQERLKEYLKYETSYQLLFRRVNWIYAQRICNVGHSKRFSDKTLKISSKSGVFHTIGRQKLTELLLPIAH